MKDQPEKISNAEVSRRTFTGMVAAALAGAAVPAEASERSRESDGNRLMVDTEPIPVGAGKFRFVGITHDGYSFTKYKDRLEEIVKDSPFVTMEYFNDDMRKISQKLMTNGGTLSFAEQFALEPFFGGIAYLAALHGKDIVIVNPQDGLEGLSDILLNTEILLSRAAPAIQTGAIALTTGAASAVLMSRRKFILGAASAAPTVAFTRATMEQLETQQMNDDFRRIVKTYGNSPERLTAEDAEKLSFYWPHAEKWRDYASTEGTQKAFEVFADEVRGKTVPGIYGTFHLGMRENLANNVTNGSTTYPYFNALGNRTIRRWRYDKAANTFDKVGEPIPY